MHFGIQSLNQKHQAMKAETIGGGGMKQNVQPKNNKKNSQSMAKNNDKLILRYCLPNEVNQKRQKNLQWKSTFLAKLRHLKFTGKKLELMQKLDEWIEENFVYKESSQKKGESL